MIKKCSIVIITFFLICFTYTCTVQRMVNIDQNVLKKQSNIYGLVKINNDWVEFDGFPAFLSKGVIKGFVKGKNGERELVSIPEKDVKKMWVIKGNFLEGFLNFFTLAGIPVYIIVPGILVITGPIAFFYGWFSL